MLTRTYSADPYEVVWTPWCTTLYVRHPDTGPVMIFRGTKCEALAELTRRKQHATADGSPERAAAFGSLVAQLTEQG